MPDESRDQPPQADEQLSLVQETESAVPPRRRSGQRWEEAHQRVTFYCPRDLLRTLELEAVRSDRSKTQVVVDALREHLERR